MLVAELMLVSHNTCFLWARSNVQVLLHRKPKASKWPFVSSFPLKEEEVDSIPFPWGKVTTPFPRKLKGFHFYISQKSSVLTNYLWRAWIYPHRHPGSHRTMSEKCWMNRFATGVSVDYILLSQMHGVNSLSGYIIM